MPKIEIWDGAGTHSVVTSSDDEVIRRWLIEQARKLTSTDSALTCQLRVWPLPVPSPPGLAPVWDWPVAGTCQYALSLAKMQALYQWLEEAGE
jgi:hypothetical protein